MPSPVKPEPKPKQCGNGVCDEWENYISCPEDCPKPEPKLCGNGVCDPGEDYIICPDDCESPITPEFCGDGQCSLGENSENCCIDCGFNVGSKRNQRCMDDTRVVVEVCKSTGLWGSEIVEECSYEAQCIGDKCVLHKIEIDIIDVSNAIVGIPRENIQPVIEVSLSNLGNVGEDVIVECTDSEIIRTYLPIGETSSWGLKWNPTLYGDIYVTCVARADYTGDEAEKKIFVDKSEWLKFKSKAESYYPDYLGSNFLFDHEDSSIKKKGDELFRSNPEDTAVAVYKYVLSLDYDMSIRLKYECPSASQILGEERGICADKSVLLTALMREQGIPAKSIRGCTLPLCNWYDIGCYLPRWLFGENGHAWNYIWLDGKGWIFVDATMGDLERKNPQLVYSREEECGWSCDTTDILGAFPGNCYYGFKCWA